MNYMQSIDFYRLSGQKLVKCSSSWCTWCKIVIYCIRHTRLYVSCPDFAPTLSQRRRKDGAPVIFQDVVHSERTGEADCAEQSSFPGVPEWTFTRMPDLAFVVERP